ncbi:MAG TPA: glycosyltransferase family 2 protein [Woeseiaceae bacterium]|nr:glycosyltransferase family 2 protein [Woeseiaceae bacterium]
MQPKVYVILVNYNGWADTIECASSLRMLSYSNFQIVIVDNCSADDSVSKIQGWVGGERRPVLNGENCEYEFGGLDTGSQVAAYSWVEAITRPHRGQCDLPLILIENPENRGFSGGNNVGIRFGLSRGDADYFWLLNNDTVVDDDALNALVERFRECSRHEESIAMCGSLILDFDRRDQVQAFGGAMVNRFLGSTRNLFAGKDAKCDDVIQSKKLPDYVSGCSMLVKAENFSRTGFLDEAYFLYWEDAEWCFRCKRRGMSLAVASRSRVWHRRGSTSGRYPIIAFYNTRNCLQFFRDYLPAYLVFCLIAKPLFFTIIALKHRNWPFFRESLRGYWRFLKGGRNGRARW